MNKFTKWIKDLLIPHAGNDHKPHFFREYMLGLALILAVFLLGASFTGSLYIKNTNMTAAVLSAVLIDLTNKDRSLNGEEYLQVSPVLEKAAYAKVEDMVANQYFAHYSPTGISPWHWMKESGYNFIYAGENLAIDFTESVDVEDAWMNSPMHKKNIIDKRFTEIGVAVKEADFQGRKTTFVVQMFGRPAITESLSVNNDLVGNPLPVQKITQVKQESNALGDVLGESAKSTESIKIISETNELIMAEDTRLKDKNIEEPFKAEDANITVSESQKIIYKSSVYIDTIYKIMIYMALFAMLLFVGIEFKKKHLKNAVYGFIVIVIIILLSIINKALFISPVLS